MPVLSRQIRSWLLLAQLFQDRRFQQALMMIRVEGGKDFIAKIRHDKPVITAVRVDECARIGRAVERQSGKDETGSPTFGTVTELVKTSPAERFPAGAKQLRRLAGIETQVSAPDLDNLAAYPQPTEPERRIDAGGEHDGDLLRATLNQAFHAAVHAVVGDQVVVVDDRNQRLGNVDQFVHNSGHDDQVVALGANDYPLQTDGEGRVNVLDGLDKIGPEPDRIRVVLLRLKPSNGFGHASH